MKLLKKMLLINWHYFWHECIEFENINFLTGKNAAGKSTMIDAMQLLLLGDTSGYFFNKAANEKSARNLKGYLRGEVGDDGDVGFNYLRDGRFTSYIACEFYDHLKDNYFTLGVVFDCYEDGDHDHRFFVLNDTIPDNGFVVEGVPMSYKDLRNYFNKNYSKRKFDFPDSNRRYQDILKGKLGGVKNKYFSLFKKAVPFSPIIDIETFITEYICDVRGPVDISFMQQNIRYYKRLEQDAELMEERISALQDIASKYAAYSDENQRLKVQTYIVDRANHQAALDNFKTLQGEMKSKAEAMERLEKEQRDIEGRMRGLKVEREKLVADKIGSDIYRKMEELRNRKAEIQEKLEGLKGRLRGIVKDMRKYGLIWRENINALKRAEPPAPGEAHDRGRHLQWAAKDWAKLDVAAAKAIKYANILIDADEDKLLDIAGVKGGVGVGDARDIAGVKGGVGVGDGDGGVEGDSGGGDAGGNIGVGAGDAAGAVGGGFADIRESIDNLKNIVSRVAHSHSEAKEGMAQRLGEVKEQVAGLERGIKPYDGKLLELKDEITAALRLKYGTAADVHILADLLEIKDARWRNAIEGFLHTQKFYLIVEPEHFTEALKVYDRLKFEKNFYGWGLVDIEKLAAKRPERLKGSLAEEVATDNPFARQFVDYVLGRLIKCDDVAKLRNYERSITDSCMLYQGFVARQLHPGRWEYPYIGRKSIEEQIKVRRREMADLERDIVICEDRLHVLEGLISMEAVNHNEAQNIVETLKGAGVIPVLEKKRREIIDELGTLDLTWLTKLDKKIDELDRVIDEYGAKEKSLIKESARLETEINGIKAEKMPAANSTAEGMCSQIEESFSEGWVKEHGEPRFQKELKSRKCAADVARAFYSQVARTRSQAQKKKDDLVGARADYIRDYRMPYDVNAEDNSVYQRELSQLQDVKLPDYKNKIQDAREKAYEQFRDDFLAKLKSNIDNLNIQMDELNGAIKEFSFGNDRYRFVSKPKLEYRRYYDMITDNMLLEGYNINSQIFRDKHRDAIDELFRQITDVASELDADARAQLEKNIKRFTDYRTYLSFDLQVTDEEGQKQRLSRTLHKKSGGETQTPFYISVLASFAQLYRIRERGEAGNTIRLIVFDEAFSKMDSERIQESIRLLRRLGLQAILSAPTEKIGDIAPLVDRNLCVIRNGNSSFVKAFDSKRLGAFDYES